MSLQSFRELVAPDHPWSRPVAGTVESLTDVRRDDVVRVYEAAACSENLILTIRGGGSRDSMVRRAKQIFGGRGPGGGWTTKRSDASEKRTPTSLVSPPAPTREARRAEHVLGKRQSHLRLGAVIEVPEADRPALMVARLVLSDRLQMDLREGQGLAYSVGASISPLGAGARAAVRRDGAPRRTISSAPNRKSVELPRNCVRARCLATRWTGWSRRARDGS